MSSPLATVRERFSHLPVSAVLDQLTDSLRDGHAVLSAPTGSGKTTLAPLALLNSDVAAGSRIILLEPRRIAARAAAWRMSAMLGETVGTTVGYRTRTDTRVSRATRIEVVTEGILIRRLQQDPELRDCSLIIFDEFHERNLQTDLGLALCLDLAELRDDLRLVVMSATLDTETICQLLGNAAVIQATGRSYPVAVSHLPPPLGDLPLARQVERGVVHAWLHTEGDILAFLPGTAEIQQCRRLLEETLPQACILPLYGNLSHQEQDRIFHRQDARRRIILATPIAETSLTIEDISSVVDSGYYRRPVFDHGRGLSRLATFRISRASADQRAGRAGRLGPGHCFRLWSLATDQSLLAHTPPEIIGADLSALVLELALWGVTDPLQLRWLDPPRQSAWDTAVTLLRRLGLVDLNGRISALGRQVAQQPMHPRLGVMLILAAESGWARTAAIAAALLAERDILKGESSTDLEERIRILMRFARQPASLPREADRSLCQRLLQYADAWPAASGADDRSASTATGLGSLLAHGYPDRIARLRPGSRSRYQLSGGGGAELGETDPLSGTPLLVIPQLDGRQGDARIFLAAAVTEEELRLDHPQLFEETEVIGWDSQEKRVKTELQTRLGNIILQSRPLVKIDTERLSQAFLDGVRQSGAEQLPWSREARDLQARICSLHAWQPEDWPDLGDAALLADLSWLAPYCHDMRSLAQLAGLNLKTMLLSRLSWQQQVQLDSLAPTHLQMPSGSRIRLEYSPGESPVLAVRLQELFGLTDTPCVYGGKIPVLLHLLSPARRVMQVTTDLRSFWASTYQQVRKELAGRYPKHSWPENPLEAQATARTKKQAQRDTR